MRNGKIELQDRKKRIGKIAKFSGSIGERGGKTSTQTTEKPRHPG